MHAQLPPTLTRTLTHTHTRTHTHTHLHTRGVALAWLALQPPATALSEEREAGKTNERVAGVTGDKNKKKIKLFASPLKFAGWTVRSAARFGRAIPRQENEEEEWKYVCASVYSLSGVSSC